MSLAIVTATLDWPRAQDCTRSWMEHARDELTLYVVGQKIGTTISEPGWEHIGKLGGFELIGYKSPEILGVVPAFAIGVQKALDDGHEIIACLHDDLLIEDPGWDLVTTALFRTHPKAGLAGYGGGMGLADEDIYRTPYNPMQLARKGFVSNMRDANAHGARSLQWLRVACLDGFSQIGRADFWRCLQTPTQEPREAYRESESVAIEGKNLFSVMEQWGIVHHAYDSALGCFAKRLGWETWMLPVACHHFGGRTAVGDPNYQAWARLKQTGVTEGDCGDAGFWKRAHKIVYDQFRDVLPIRLP